MNSMTIVVLGGCGNTGALIARYLLQETNCEIILAGRNKARAEQLASKLKDQPQGWRVSGAFVDAAEAESLKRVFANVGMVVVASSTTRFTQQIAEAALASHCDYFDIQFSQLARYRLLRRRLQLVRRMARKNRTLREWALRYRSKKRKVFQKNQIC